MNSVEFTHTFEHESDTVYFSLTVPYTTERMVRDAAKWVDQGTAIVKPFHYGLNPKPSFYVLLGDKVDCITRLKERKVLVLMAGEDPRDAAGGHAIHGFVSRYLSNTNEKGQCIRESLVLLVFPCLNPDGLSLGNSVASPTTKYPSLSWSNPTKEIKAAKKIIDAVTENNEILGVLRFKCPINSKNVTVSREINERDDQSRYKHHTQYKQLLSIIYQHCYLIRYTNIHYTSIPPQLDTSCSLYSNILSLCINIPTVYSPYDIFIHTSDLHDIGHSLYDSISTYLISYRLIKHRNSINIHSNIQYVVYDDRRVKVECVSYDREKREAVRRRQSGSMNNGKSVKGSYDSIMVQLSQGVSTDIGYVHDSPFKNFDSNEVQVNNDEKRGDNDGCNGVDRHLDSDNRRNTMILSKKIPLPPYSYKRSYTTTHNTVKSNEISSSDDHTYKISLDTTYRLMDNSKDSGMDNHTVIGYNSNKDNSSSNRPIIRNNHKMKVTTNSFNNKNVSISRNIENKENIHINNLTIEDKTANQSSRARGGRNNSILYYNRVMKYAGDNSIRLKRKKNVSKSIMSYASKASEDREFNGKRRDSLALSIVSKKINLSINLGDRMGKR